MTTLIIKNKGLIESGDLTLIGSSTKRDDSSKIGMYGSGNKYALAQFLRNNIDIRIFSGLEEIQLSHEIVQHRERNVAVLTVNGERTSITSEMGPEWTGWMALRELVSNAIDEGEYEITTGFNTECKGIEDNTMIHIPLNNELNTVIRNYDHYFAFDRKPAYSNKYGKVYLKSEQTMPTFYRKGIKCFEEKDKTHLTWLEYDLDDVTISESRVCDEYERNDRIKDFIYNSTDIPVNLLIKALEDGTVKYYMNSAHITQFTEIINQEYNVVSEKLQRVMGILLPSTDKDLIVPHGWWELLSKERLVKNPFKGDLEFVETNTYDTSEIKYLLMALGMEDIEVFAGKMDTHSPILTNNSGHYFIKEDTICTPKQLVAKIIKMLPENYIIEKIID